MTRVIPIAATLALCAAFTAQAQRRALPDRIAAPARGTIERLIDSAETAGIPRGPLYDKAAEGVLKGAPDDRIVRAVQILVRQLGDARDAIGPSVDNAVLGAGASAIMAGVSPAELRRLAHPPGPAPDPAMLTTALVTLVDLVSKHVPVGVATSSIQNLIVRRATDRQFSVLRTEVERDILAGVAPEASLATRMRQAGAPPNNDE
jgi:hypothetical protein